MNHLKFLLFFIFIITLQLNAGFFNEQGAKDKAEFIENDRLCKIFTKKVEDYKEKMRDDILATVSLASYEYRKELFCSKAEELNQEINGSK